MKNKIREIQYPINEIKDSTHFIHNFEVSVIMPFYKKIKEFKRVFPKNVPYFQRNGIEIVIAMDEDSEEEALINFINQYQIYLMLQNLLLLILGTISSL